jgi:lipopolysaccharide transport system permease protein
VVFAIFDSWPGTTGLLALLGFAVWVFDACVLTVLLGTLCARFRDIPPIVGSLLQMAFFVTPVIWKPELINAKRQWLLPLNPFNAMLEIVRAPLLGAPPSTANCVSALLYSLALIVGTWFLFVRVRGRIAFWV